MFSKAKVKRFNEEVSCAPPPTKYDPKVKNSSGCSLERSNRWYEQRDITPGPTQYLGSVLPSDIGAVITPKRKGSSNSISRLNTSVSSSTSASSHSGFISPQPKPLLRSKSFRAMRKPDSQCAQLEEKIRALLLEKNEMGKTISSLGKELIELKNKLDENKLKPNLERSSCDFSTQVNLNENEVVDEPLLLDQPQDLRCPKKRDEENKKADSFSNEELQLLRDQVDHLILLRNNLEASVAAKEEAISDLQMQIDLIVLEAEESHEKVEICRRETTIVKEELERTIEEKKNSECRVKNLISQYEILARQHDENCIYKDAIAQKDVEIELLNDSISTLNTQISEYEKTMSRIQSEVTLKQSQIFNLEVAVGDLSIATKEKEFMETMLEDEIEEKNKEVSKLELSLKDVETKLKETTDDRETLLAKLEEEKMNSVELTKKVAMLEVNLKEKEVVQQFLEKEVSSREAEVSSSLEKASYLEKDLEIAHKVALDLQEEAELHLNEVFCLKASMSAKDYDLESKDDLIAKLKEEVSVKASTTQELEKNITTSDMNQMELMKELDVKESKIKSLEDNISTLKLALDEGEENTNHLETRIVQLMVEITESESQLKKSLLEKESEVEELSVKYSDTLMEQESTKRLLMQAAENLEKQNFLLQATERDLVAVRGDLAQTKTDYGVLESSLKELTHKLIHIEDALACEEAASRDYQKKFEQTHKLFKSACDEIEALKSANEGYSGQISMLKIDMTKKSLAVEDMQNRIDELREEKTLLLENKTLLEDEMAILDANRKLLESALHEKEVMLQDLQEEFEGKLQTITRLQSNKNENRSLIEELSKKIDLKNQEEEERVMAFEEEKSVFFNQISLLENHLKEEQDQRAQYKTKAIEMEDKVQMIEEEKEKAIQGFNVQLKNEKIKVEELEEKLKTLQERYEGYEDQLINMQTSLMDKTTEAERWNQSYHEANVTSESYKEKINELKSNISKLAKESEQLSSSLASKDAILTSLNDSVSEKSDEIQSLHKNLEEKQDRISCLELRLQAMDKTVTSLKEERDRNSSRIVTLQESLDITKEQLSRLNISYSKEQDERLAALVAEHENQMKELRQNYASLQEEAALWKGKFEHLENMIEPFREQLDAYELEKSTLALKSSAAEEEMKKLSEEYAKLLGHQNHKQKIQHVVKLKTENNILKERVLKLQTELEKQKKAVRRLEEKGEHHLLARGRSFVSKTTLRDVENKENTPATSDLRPQDTSTPLRSSSLNNRFRRL